MRNPGISLFLEGIPILVLIALVVGCGAAPSSSMPARHASTVLPTVTPLPSPTEMPAQVASGAVAGCQSTGTKPVQFVAVGALKVSTPFSPLAYPSELIPSNTPSAPYQIAASEVSGGYQPNPRVNPSLGYVLTLCNTTSSVHVVSGVAVNITGFSPSSGAVDEWNLCDGPYNTTTKTAMGGCGGGIGGPGIYSYSAALPNDTVGAMATFQPTNGSPGIPFSLEPNTSLSLVVTPSGVTSQGTYAVAFDISVDGAASTALAPSDGSFLIAPGAVKWTGQSCETSAMQAQIPASSQAIYYACPLSS